MALRQLPPEQRAIRRVTNTQDAIRRSQSPWITASRHVLGSVDVEALAETIEGILLDVSRIKGRDGLSDEQIQALIDRRFARYLGSGGRLNIALKVDTLIGQFQVDLDPILRRLMHRAAGAGRAVFEKAWSITLDLPTFAGRVERSVDLLVAEAVTRIEATTKATIKDLILQGFEEGRHPRVTSRLLADTVGLDARRARAFDRFVAGLQADPPDLSEAAIQRLIDREYSRLLRSRANIIARTENANTAAATQLELWREAEAEGKLSGLRYVRVWVRIPGAKPCPVCGPLKGKRARINGYFSVGGKIYLRAPGHPACLCGEMLDNWRDGDEDLPFLDDLEEAA